MKDYQNLIGMVIIGIAIVISGFIIANSIESGLSNIFSAINSMGTLIRDGLLQIGSAS